MINNCQVCNLNVNVCLMLEIIQLTFEHFIYQIYLCIQNITMFCNNLNKTSRLFEFTFDKFHWNNSDSPFYYNHLINFILAFANIKNIYFIPFTIDVEKLIQVKFDQPNISNFNPKNYNKCINILIHTILKVN